MIVRSTTSWRWISRGMMMTYCATTGSKLIFESRVSRNSSHKQAATRYSWLPECHPAGRPTWRTTECTRLTRRQLRWRTSCVRDFSRPRLFACSCVIASGLSHLIDSPTVCVSSDWQSLIVYRPRARNWYFCCMSMICWLMESWKRLIGSILCCRRDFNANPWLC